MMLTPRRSPGSLYLPSRIIMAVVTPAFEVLVQLLVINK